MKTVSHSLSLSLSIVAIGISAYAIVNSGSTNETPNDGSDAEVIAALQTEIDELRKELATVKRPPRADASKKKFEKASFQKGEKSGANDVKTSLLALEERMKRLESAETIHALARDGKKQQATRKIEESLATLQDRDAPARERVAALRELRAARKSAGKVFASALENSELKETDFAWPMIEIAQNGQHEPELRADAVRNLAGMRTAEIREPLIDLLTNDGSPEVRAESVGALVWHLDDENVRTAMRAAVNDESPQVQNRAQRMLPKVDYVEREAARREGNTDAAPTENGSK